MLVTASWNGFIGLMLELNLIRPELLVILIIKCMCNGNFNNGDGSRQWGYVSTLKFSSKVVYI